MLADPLVFDFSMDQNNDYFRTLYAQNAPYPPPPSHPNSSRLLNIDTSCAPPPVPNGYPFPVPSTPAPSDPSRSRTSSLNEPKQTRPPLSTALSGSDPSIKGKASRQTSETGEGGGGGDGAGATPGGSSNGAATKAKRTRNRKPASCAQCRKKKLRCNRADPCDQCTL